MVISFLFVFCWLKILQHLCAMGSYLITICTSVSVAYLFTTLSIFTTIWYLQTSAISIGKETLFFNIGHLWLFNLFELLDQSKWSPTNLILEVSNYSFEDPGPHGTGRYSEHMLPEIERKDFRKGSQVDVVIYWLLLTSTTWTLPSQLSIRMKFLFSQDGV